MQSPSHVPGHVSTSFYAASSPTGESSCSLDALERLVCFIGAGADACLFAVNPPQVEGPSTAALTATAEGLRYWLNPSVRARQTTATCEITNLGPPFFVATSTSVLSISVAPLFRDGRCFPTRCVVSLATSAQRLDGVSLRPVVVTEWNMTLNESTGVCMTTVPLRTLYHLAVLISSSTPETDIDQVRLYLQLRFMGCTDNSDTHRIAAVRLRYEQLGTAAEVLPQLLKRHQRVAARMMLPASSCDAKDYSGDPVSRAHAVLGRVDAGVATSRSTRGIAGNDVGDSNRGVGRFSASKMRCAPASPPSTEVGADQCESAAGVMQRQLLCSPPKRSATRPRSERSLSAGRSSSPHIETGSTIEEADDARLIRVERAQRFPLPLPMSASTAGSEPPSCGGPWPPRKMRTIVLAPSISPSLCSSSAGTSPRGSSPPSSPPPRTNAYPSGELHSSSSLTGILRCRSLESCDRGGSKDSVGAPTTTTTQNVREPDLESTRADGRRSSPASAVQPSSQRHHHHEFSPTLRYTCSLETQKVSPEVVGSSSDPQPQPLCATSDSAVLWSAISLLGTQPWALDSQSQSHVSASAASVAISRAPSCDCSASAISAESARGEPCWQTRRPTPSRVFLDSGAGAHGANAPQPPRLQQPPWRQMPLSTLDPNTSYRSSERRTAPLKRSSAAMTTSTRSADATVAPSLRWRGDVGSTHVSPQLHPPRSSAITLPLPSHSEPFCRSPIPSKATTYASSHRTTSAFVPRLLLRSGQRSAEVYVDPSTASRRDMGTTKGSSRNNGSATTSTTRASASLPSRGRGLWPKAVTPAATSPLLNAVSHRSATGDLHERRRMGRATISMSSPATLSVTPSSRLLANENAVPQAFANCAADMLSEDALTSPRGSRLSTAPRPSHRPQQVSSLLSVAISERTGDTLSVGSGDSAPLTPPQSPPPRQSRVLFHRPASTQPSWPAPPFALTPRTDAAPALPLQEAHHGNRNQNRLLQRSATSLGSGCSSINAVIGGHSVVHTFAVWKHHSSRRGAGRRRLRIEQPHPSLSASTAIRFRIALDKERPSISEWASMLLGRNSNTSETNSIRTVNTSCEVCIRWMDTVEVWCGLHAYHSGLIHQSKVHQAECCLVIRCNSQLVTAVELESTEAVHTVRRLLAGR
ncbi:hypothetical protein JKF63_00362 [Porcisia hertigi]|uniref:PH-like domain-containing protein n=1 Tax=Porcisia hertigi TaxID=2761500 RepID=A0A836I9F1_9TRYP|nr:hypothetical protein JKF63_00362 [Porcisia hertigi]